MALLRQVSPSSAEWNTDRIGHSHSGPSHSQAPMASNYRITKPTGAYDKATGEMIVADGFALAGSDNYSDNSRDVQH